ncbi:hypothetical protein V8B97DRAFT_1135268 [Scleroderma yunnanense]
MRKRAQYCHGQSIRRHGLFDCYPVTDKRAMVKNEGEDHRPHPLQVGPQRGWTSLTGFLCTRDLVNVVHDVIVALSEAFVLAKIPHHDISVGNIIIIIDKNSKFKQGLLTDWDLCKDITKAGVRQRDRTSFFDEYNPAPRTSGEAKEAYLGAGIYIPRALELKQTSPLLKLLRALVIPYTSVYGQPRMAATLPEFGEGDQSVP